MSANDNAMARFLFAILQQKDLKDIDWNKVAHNPILTQEISNGHAARMRYSRFRASMLGLEPQRRNRVNPNRSRVSKKKKDELVKKEQLASSPNAKLDDSTIQQHDDSNSNNRASPPAAPGSSLMSMSMSPQIKDEMTFASPESQFGFPALTTTAMSGAQTHHSRMNNARLLTPCSDSDVMAASGGGFSPTLQTADYDFSSHHPHHQSHCLPDGVAWHHHHHHDAAYNGFAVDYGLDTYSSAFDDSHPDQQHAAEELGVHTAMMNDEEDSSDAMVKREEWDMHGYH
ncbi:hypothetical protein B0T17DRAFT_611731 [Bombardia bombarda]|uniref:Myb-like DNA-binding domain-containing protein n=1 Tax=Bombardia bombarda TaxID=252184 RepID=A0AA39XJH9_9PEZI|nr:hypothetical protein B0T17DRAFT_611731 [Bombardia bombarda]